ncbi:hypothetical protein A1OW_09495 [Enterovibrio norvegicus]|uniref:hypothetical protein n=1 Tax=Enterovibrio norvegicus TaxID=188144 RepID=UPI0003618E90|nr:hypothetical protein [Enterovibrio norvegicus]OEF51872.1 hypothetical protein A1OW_09495 [Enterovibrio norvegicus]
MLEQNYRRLLRSLLLPINPKLEDACVEALELKLSEILRDHDADHSSWMMNQVEDWSVSEKPSKELKGLIAHILLIGNNDYRDEISEQYFSCHKELITNQLLGFEIARSYLSHLLLVARLADEEQMSAAQIAVIMNAMNPSVGFDRRSLQPLLSKLKMAASIDARKIEELWETDKNFIVDAFGDFNLDECIDKTAMIGKSLGYTSSMKNHLSTLFNSGDDLSKYTPYIQILHFQCSILEFFDHLSKDFYEFSPRGAAANALFDKYPACLVNASNPFLNNAKSVAQIAMSWASSKKQRDYGGALSLFEVLNGLDELGYAARKELAQWIRTLIHRFMTEVEPVTVDIPQDMSAEGFVSLVNLVSRANTKSRGIIEQRLVDALSAYIHRENWRSRGIGDPVNASNFSKKKLGDCDFQNFESKNVIAYEAHGGVLTQSYLDEHMKTLSKLAKPRIDEWRQISEPEEWRVNIKFIAHAINASVPDDVEIDGVIFTIELMTYETFICQFNFEEARPFLNDYFLGPLSGQKTPSFVRDAFYCLLTSNLEET